MCFSECLELNGVKFSECTSSTASQLKKNIPSVENVVKKATDDLKRVTEAEAKASEKVTIIIINHSAAVY